MGFANGYGSFSNELNTSPGTSPIQKAGKLNEESNDKLHFVGECVGSPCRSREKARDTQRATQGEVTEGKSERDRERELLDQATW